MAKQPNILFIMGDDIGITNLSCYSHGILGYETPNIDRIAKEGIMFTDFYGEQSCTAGRAAFITGQSPFRSGLTKVGMPHAKEGILPGTATLAWALKEQGYRTGQFGKNHFGDQDEHLPTAHGFDEFYGVFYHLNVYETPENPDYPKDPEFFKNFGPKNLTYSYADGRQEDKGRLDSERMKTIDDEFGEATIDFMKRAVDADEPFFVWHNTTHMHYHTHTKDSSKGQSGRWQNGYHDTMIDHDKNIGELLDKLDEWGIADDTIVVYTTDNGPHMNMWPDSAMTPFRNEKNSNWEGAFRVPGLARYPAKWRKGEVLKGIVSLMDFFPTIMTEAGNPDIIDQMKKGGTFGGAELKAHIDGLDMTEYFSGKSDESPREIFVFVTDDGDVAAVRYDNWKIHFLVQAEPGTLAVWMAPYIKLRAPLIFNLRTDPYERANITSNTYFYWMEDEAMWIMIPIKRLMGEILETFKEFPPLQSPGSFTIGDAVKHMENQNFGA